MFGSSLNVDAGRNPAFNSDSALLRLMRTDARFCGRSLRVLLLAVVPIITFLVAIASLLYINLPLTLGILLLMTFTAGFQYRVSVAGARSSTLMEKYSGGISSEYRRIIKQQKSTSVPLPMDRPWLNKVFEKGHVKGYLNATEGRLNVLMKSRLVSDIFLAAAIAIIMITMGASIIAEKHGWSNLIIYLVALRYMLVNMKSSVSRFTSLNRFYPQIRRYFQFIENVGTRIGSIKELPEDYMIQPADNNIEDSLLSWKLKRGSRVGLLSPVVLNRYTIAYLAACLIGDSHEKSGTALNSMWFIASMPEFHPGTLRESLLLSQGYTSDDFVKEMEHAGLWIRLKEQLTGDLDTSVPTDTWDRIEPDLQLALAFLTAVHTDAQWVMLDGKGLSSLPDKSREYFLRRLSDRIMVIVYNDMAAIGSCNEEVIAVIDENKLLGLGSAEWVYKHESLITDLLRKSAGVTSEMSGLRVAEDDDDLYDDM